jgi:hypothetical protein
MMAPRLVISRVGIVVLVGILVLAGGWSAPAAAQPAGSVCFPETGQCLAGRFLAHWQATGGLPIHGFPITGERVEPLPDGTLATVQYFERARFEFHPANPAPFDVLLGHLGRQFHPPAPPAAPLPGARFFPATGHNLGGAFRTYWEQRGGLAQFGYPLTEELVEAGRTVQYFERARFEAHPENPAPYQVLLGLLGRRLLSETTPPVAPPCPAEALRGQIVFQGAAGTREGVVSLINDGPAGCALAGQPTVALLDGAGAPLTVEVSSTSAVTADTVTAVALAPGGAARVALRWSNWCGPAPGPVTVALTLPAGGTLRAPAVDDQGRPVDPAPPCLGPGQPSRLAVGPVTAGGAGWGAVAVVTDFYRAINARDFLAAYALLGPALQRQPFIDFQNGYATTEHVQVSILGTTGTPPGDADGVNVALAARQTDGTTQRFRGSYTVGPADGRLRILAATIVQDG